MKAIFRRLELQNSRRDVMVKESLTSQLMSCIKEVQLEHAHLQNEEEELKTLECTNFLCTVLEAIFIHGLKESLADRFSMAIASPDRKPEPEFWSPIMVFSHRDIIKQILKMSQITTDIGRCRAWIRLALNDGLLISYLETITQQNNAFSPYYKKYAYLRDIEALIIAKSILDGISSIHFSLPTNSSILNVWTNTPLLLAGIWTAPMKSCPVFTGTDVAKTLSVGETVTRREEDTVSLLSLASNHDSPAGFGKYPGLYDYKMTEDEALKIILGTPIEGSPLQSISNIDKFNPDDVLNPSDPDNEECVVMESSSNITPGFDMAIKEMEATEQLHDTRSDKVADPSDSVNVTKSQQISNPDLFEKSKTLSNQSYQSILKSYTPTSSPYFKTPDLQDFLQRFESFSPDSPSPDSNGSDDVAKMGFEVVSKTETSIKAPEFRNMTENVSRIMQEPGLDSQNFSCIGCGQPIGISFTKARLCALTGWYFCSDCFSSEEWIIPARILQNWDFGRYEVSGKAASFLNEVQYHPLLDVRRINPKLYLAIQEMAEIQRLRLQLNLLRPYLHTCREPILKKLQKLIWPREYLYEHVHLYSISDLVEISSGVFGPFLQKMIKFSQDHVITCCLCSQKGFFCEICKDEKIIYPFDLEISFRCLLCKGVFHVACRDKIGSCPKCERIKKRQAEVEKEE